MIQKKTPLSTLFSLLPALLLLCIGCSNPQLEAINPYDQSMLLSASEIAEISGFYSKDIEEKLETTKDTFYDNTFNIQASFDPDDSLDLYQLDISVQKSFSDSLLSSVGNYLIDKTLREELGSMLVEIKTNLDIGTPPGVEVVRYSHLEDNSCYAMTVSHDHHYKKFHIVIINPAGISIADSRLAGLLTDKIRLFESIKINSFYIEYGTNRLNRFLFRTLDTPR